MVRRTSIQRTFAETERGYQGFPPLSTSFIHGIYYVHTSLSYPVFQKHSSGQTQTCLSVCHCVKGWFSPLPLARLSLPCRSFIMDKNALSEKMSKIFLVIGIFVVGRTSSSGHNCWHIPKNRSGDLKIESLTPPTFSRFHVAHHRYCIHQQEMTFF